MEHEPPQHIQVILDNLPAQPGVYIMKDAGGKVIYVGKSVSLRSRVRSYFGAQGGHSARTRRMVGKIADIEFIVTPSEAAALKLENDLIKKHQPRYNILLKDDKWYPYIKVHWADDFPKVDFTRHIERDGSRYFGPYTSAGAVRQTLDVLRRAFPYLTCDREITGNDARACLYYDIGLCSAPCIGAVGRDEYRGTVSHLMRFLQGYSDEVLKDLHDQMMAASDALDFERAAALRDKIKAVERVVRGHVSVARVDVEQDVIAVARDEQAVVVQVFFVRAGKIIGRDYFALDGAEEEEDCSEIVTEFLKRFYAEATSIPAEIILPAPPVEEEAGAIAAWLHERRDELNGRPGKKVTLSVPQRGRKLDLLNMARENATETLALLHAQWDADTHRQEQAIAELQEALGLSNPPNRIECYDISNTQGTAITASRVVFVQGVPLKKEYRRFHIKTVQGPDDYASMREALTRRFKRYADAVRDESSESAASAAAAAPGQPSPDDTWRILPDLLIVDGGKGQLNVAVEVLGAFDLLDRVPVAGLAKQHEDVFLPGRDRPVILPRRSPALYLVQRVRDEAHRFALALHRNQRRKQGIVSQLESVPGIGPARRKALLKAFGSVDAIREASIEALTAVPGINAALAQAIKAAL
ncbi:MAG: excinuclease ABC subunit UvrC [Anaerolineae bacterium]|nr:excinuclease ABC subunit UvrC [Anaerolineae bacterium]